MWAVVAVVLLAAYSPSRAQQRVSPPSQSGVSWIEDYDAAQRQRQALGKPLVVYISADYCGYCRKMERDTWSDPSIARRIHRDFVALKLDAERNENWVARLGVRGLPTTIFFDAAGRRAQSISGYSSPSASYFVHFRIAAAARLCLVSQTRRGDGCDLDFTPSLPANRSLGQGKE